MNFKYTLLGIIFDAFDYLIFGLLPIVGDILDLLALVFWYTKLGAIGVVSGIELLPGMDILPTNIALGIIADRKKGVK